MSAIIPSFTPPRPLLSRQTQLRATLKGIEDLVYIALGTGPTVEDRSGVLRYYEHLRSASPEARTQVLSDACTSCWVDRGSRLAASRHPELLPTGPWRRHLEDLSRFALASAVLDRVSFNACVPVDSSCRIVLPGANLVLTVTDGWRPRVNVIVDVSGQITIDGTPTNASCLTIASGFRIAAEESSLRPGPIDGFVPLSFDRIDLIQWAKVLSSVREIVETHESSRELIAAFATTLVPLESASNDKHLSVSFGECPGVVYLAFSSDPHVLAEAIVHEADHQWNNAIGQQMQLWRGAPAGRPACYRSPWRPDPRPLDGLLLGASAFVSVGEMWTELAANSGEYAGSRAAYVLCQSLEALSQVKAFGDLTDSGLGFVSWLESRASSAFDRLKDSEGFRFWHDEARGRMREQRTAWEIQHGHPDFTVPGLLPMPANRFPGASPDEPGGTLEFAGIFIDLDTPHAPAALLEIDGMRDVMYRISRENGDRSAHPIRAHGSLANEIVNMEESWLRRDFDSCIAATVAALRCRPNWLFFWWRLGAAMRASGHVASSRALLFDTDSVADSFWVHMTSLKDRPSAASIAVIDLQNKP